MCKKCPSTSACNRLNEYDLPVMCEAIWDTDIIPHLERTDVIILRETGFMDRIQMWDKSIWKKYYEVAEAL